MRLDDSVSAAISRRWESVRALIDDAIERYLEGLPEAAVVEAAKYIARGGKRLRGFLLVSFAEALGASVSDALDAAVAVELVHASSLALDDIIDEDLTRRGSAAAWVRLGLKKTVMVSNILIPFAQKIVYERYGAVALERTVRAWLDISRGEVLDAFIDGERAGKETYMEMVRLKTGSLFRLSAELGAIAAGRIDLLEEASRLGEILGITYQIADDIRDSSDPLKVQREPGLKLFLKWASSLGRAYSTIDFFLAKAQRIISSIFKDTQYIIYELPRFIINAMLYPRVRSAATG